MRTLLSVICVASVGACSWLAIMFVVLHHSGFERQAAAAASFVLESLLVLAVCNGILSGAVWRVLTLAGTGWIAWSGAQAVATTLSGPHFEGFALIIGALLVLQAAVTLLHLITTGFTGSSKVHAFGS